MANLVKLDTARELVDAGAVQGAEVIGLPGGWAVQLRTYNKTQTLATRLAEPRLFSKFETALTCIRELGVHGRIIVDPENWTAEGLYTRRRPDRSAAMKLKEQDARYAAFLRQGTVQAMANPGPRLSVADARAEMAKRRAANHAKRDNA